MAEKAGEKGGSRVRRDTLVKIQAEAQARWEQEKAFEETAPEEADPENKYFANFPYPYMNGLLHLGHAFTISKAEFATAYHRLRGKKVLFPFGFHCTGMPIKACADKLEREITIFGLPPQFPTEQEQAEEEAAKTEAANKQAQESTADPTKFKTKKSKAAAKSGTAKYQWQIMQSLGLKDDEIARFRDANFWLEYFPPLAIDDLKAFGLGVDWRRSFITTDVNPYYDSFVRWHLTTLYKQGRVVKDNRYAIFSPLDKQPCADHDRASGEGVQPQEYTLIKMEVIPPLSGKLAACAGKRVYLAAATLRPETMYGQTNAWVLPDGEYGAFEINDEEVFVVAKRAALNLSYQNYSKVRGEPRQLVSVTGTELIGTALRSPLAVNEVIYCLPMLTILMDKGTGVVTSVPSDSPDDYATLEDLKKKKPLREKYGVRDEWVLPFEVVPIINIPEFGDKSAEAVCKQLKIQSQNDKDKLAEAKRLTYLKGFTEGTLLVGPHAGARVQDAKPLIRKELVETGRAILYSEPEKKVVSRSGDECVVALTDQWYLTYGEPEWRARVERCLARMNLFSDEARHSFEHTLSWLNQWACSRSFGLGSRLPWDPEYLIESLSDSTIYMAYYTVAHFLQDGDIYGRGKGAVRADQMTDAVWDFIFLDGPQPQADIDPALLKAMRQEFQFWYPFNLRVSGKDLIQNHLTFALYNHTAIFPEDKWPLGFRSNGHLMLNSEKMSKSTGNFKTLKEAVEEYSADGTRFALADAGDTMDDANFVENTANAAILSLTKELAWMEETLAALSQGALRSGPFAFADRVFSNEMDVAVTETERHYEALMFREALKSGWYDPQNARDEYRVSCGAAGMHADLARRFIEMQTLLITPFCPHFADHVWRTLLHKPGSVLVAGWPAASPPDVTLQRANAYLQEVIVDLRKLLAKHLAPPKKAPKKGAEPPAAPVKFTVGSIFIAEKFGGWQETCLTILASKFDPGSKTFPGDAELMAAVKGSEVGQRADFKAVMKQCMPFLKFKQAEAVRIGPQVLESKLPFDEAAVLQDNQELIKRTVGLEEVYFYPASDESVLSSVTPQEKARVAAATPGSPAAIFTAAPLSQR